MGFTDLNKTCPKTTSLYKKINQFIDSTAGNGCSVSWMHFWVTTKYPCLSMMKSIQSALLTRVCSIIG